MIKPLPRLTLILMLLLAIVSLAACQSEEGMDGEEIEAEVIVEEEDGVINEEDGDFATDAAAEATLETPPLDVTEEPALTPTEESTAIPAITGTETATPTPEDNAVPEEPTMPPDPTAVASGNSLFLNQSCSTCHPGGQAGTGPSLINLLGQEVELESGETIIADENYIRNSILNPQAQIVADYPPVMPSYEGRLDEQELDHIVAFIMSLSDQE